MAPNRAQAPSVTPAVIWACPPRALPMSVGVARRSGPWDDCVSRPAYVAAAFRRALFSLALLRHPSRSCCLCRARLSDAQGRRAYLKTLRHASDTTQVGSHLPKFPKWESSLAHHDLNSNEITASCSLPEFHRPDPTEPPANRPRDRDGCVVPPFRAAALALAGVPPIASYAIGSNAIARLARDFRIHLGYHRGEPTPCRCDSSTGRPPITLVLT